MDNGVPDSNDLYGTSPTITVHIPMKIPDEITTDAIVAKAIGRAIGVPVS
jgi:hypothetical protein